MLLPLLLIDIFNQPANLEVL